MRILVLVNNADDLSACDHPEMISPLEAASPRRDLATYLSQLDPKRVQPQFMAIRGQGSNSLNAPNRFDWKALRRLNAWLRAQDIELIHALGSEAMVYAALAGRMTGIPTIGAMYEVKNFGRLSAFEQIGERVLQLIRRMGIRRVIVPSQLLIKQALWHVRYPSDRMEVFYPAVKIRAENAPTPDRAALGLPSGPLAAMIAPLENDQGYYTLLDAMQRLMVRVPEAHIVVVGSGPLLMDLTKKSHRLPIRWLGERTDVLEIIAVSDAIVVHPKQPGLPMAVLEGAAAGKPVIGTRVAGITEFIEHSISGLIVTYDDSRDLAVQLGRCLTQEKLDTILGNNARKRARELAALETQRDRITALYETTVYESR